MFASYATLTPLPGTDLYQELKDQLITHEYDYFDFIHTLLPTTIPLKEFYAEYHDLYFKGISSRNQLAFLGKYPLQEIPQLLMRGQKYYKQLKNAYKDYQN
jgi:hypothetical protein